MFVYLIDGGHHHTQIQKVDVEKGISEYKTRFRGDIRDQVRDIVALFKLDKPNKIIFDKLGVSLALYELVLEALKKEGLTITEDGSLTNIPT